MSFYVYILYSVRLNKYYIGSSENVSKRLDQQHNAGKVNSTKSGMPWILKYTEIFEKRSGAVKREMEIKKKKSRKYVEWLISLSA